ncbi:cysteine hydrolase family protein [Enterovirga aerilata]|uniref:Cysteine hydrolase n=1 Tax=Enterovirga aerilata TaxID=2730920 RepID=A0A849I4X1_9HYPH|nr:isochorismatase family cysteine hydrolase [Enterovirga sp. DB1703]NNM71439.1 cysteine hydrolase [Enterovirga sp. DB1703]
MSVLLLLVDVQRAFCDPGGSMALQGRSIEDMHRAAANCGRLAAEARRREVPVVWTRMVYRPDYSDGGRLVNELRPNLKRIGALRAGTPDIEISPAAGLAPGDIVIDKTRYSSLIGTDLERMLRARGVERVIVGGVTTSMCVETTVRDLGQRDFETIVVRDACGDFAADRHEASLAALAFGFARIVDLAEGVAAMDMREKALAG